MFGTKLKNRCCPLTRALLGLWIFHARLGGGLLRTPPSISAPMGRIETIKKTFESSSEIMSSLHWTFFSKVKNEVTRGQKVKFRENSFLPIAAYLLKIGGRYMHHRVPLVKTVRMMYNMTSKGQFRIWPWPWPRSRSRSRSGGSCWVSFEPSRRDEHIGTTFTFLSSSSDAWVAKKHLWPLMTSSWPQMALQRPLIKICTATITNSLRRLTYERIRRFARKLNNLKISPLT